MSKKGSRRSSSLGSFGSEEVSWIGGRGSSISSTYLRQRSSWNKRDMLWWRGGEVNQRSLLLSMVMSYSSGCLTSSYIHFKCAGIYRAKLRVAIEDINWIVPRGEAIKMCARRISLAPAIARSLLRLSRTNNGTKAAVIPLRLLTNLPTISSYYRGPW